MLGLVSLSALTPRTDGDLGGVETDRVCTSTLIERRLPGPRGANSGGIEGRGGAPTRPELVAGRPGDWSRNVLAVIEAELVDRRRPFLLPDRKDVTLVWESEARRCTILFVWTFSTGAGEGEKLRRAVAAAAEERLLDDGWDLRKAWDAALCADCDEDAGRGYTRNKAIGQPSWDIEMVIHK